MVSVGARCSVASTTPTLGLRRAAGNFLLQTLANGLYPKRMQTEKQNLRNQVPTDIPFVSIKFKMDNPPSTWLWSLSDRKTRPVPIGQWPKPMKVSASTLIASSHKEFLLVLRMEVFQAPIVVGRLRPHRPHLLHRLFHRLFHRLIQRLHRIPKKSNHHTLSPFKPRPRTSRSKSALPRSIQTLSTP